VKYKPTKIFFGITSLFVWCLYGKEDAPIKQQPRIQLTSSTPKEHSLVKKHAKNASVISIARTVVLESNEYSDKYKPVNQTVFNIEPTASQTRPQDPVYENGHVKNPLVGRHMNKISLDNIRKRPNI